jgi:rhamnosyl/mannosyltransferase
MFLYILVLFHRLPKVNIVEENILMKVLQVNKLYHPHTGGIEKVVQQLAEGLKDQLEIEVLVCQQRGRTKVEAINGVKVTRAGSLGVLFSVPISFSFIWQLRKLSKNMDVIHFHMPFPLGDLACLLSGYIGKVVVWWHSDVVRQKTLMKFYRPIMERFLKRADAIIVATQGHIDGSDYLPKYIDKCIIIPYGVDPEIEQRADDYYLNKVPMKKDILNILFVGRLVYYKGCDILIDAFQTVKGAELTIIGSGEYEEVLRQQAIDCGCRDRIHFLGSVDDESLSKAFEECDVFVLPSVLKSEAFGLVQIEAMAYGKPVINTNLPSGVPYVSIEGLTGLTVEPNNAKALANAMQWMVDHKDERNEMGHRARQRVTECYRIENMLEAIRKVYEA